MQEAHQKAEYHGSKAEKAEEDPGGHADQPQALDDHQGEKHDGNDLKRDEDQRPNGPGEDAAFSGLAVPQVGHGDPMEIVKAVTQGVVTKIGLVVTVCPKVPLA